MLREIPGKDRRDWDKGSGEKGAQSDPQCIFSHAQHHPR